MHRAHQPVGEEVVGTHELCRQSGIGSLQPVQRLYHRLAVGDGGKALLMPRVGVGDVHMAVVQLVNGIVLGGLAHPVDACNTLAQGCLDFLGDIDILVLHFL